MSENKKKKGLSKGLFVGIWSAAFLLLIGGTIALSSVAGYYDSIITSFLGTIKTGNSSSVPGSSNLYELDEDYSTEKEAEICKQVAEEGIVMVKNDNSCLPLGKNKKVSVFGLAGATGATVGTGSGASASKSASIQGSLEAASIKVNEKLLDYYKNNSKAHGKGTAAGSGNDKGDWSLGKEASFPTDASLLATLDEYKDAAIFVITRSGGEGGDLTRSMGPHGGSDNEHYLELTQSEKDVLIGIKNSGKFQKTILIVNSANAMELGFLATDEYGIDSCLIYSGLGTTGLEAVGEIIAGDKQPSARLVDTYVYDNFSAPAMQNFGDFRFTDNGSLMNNSYMNYAENIYVGYKYYETRYEDKILNTANVGTYDYKSTVLYPFGYGLSYSTYTWSNYKCEVKDGKVNVSLDVTNNGDLAGKDVVEIYYQSQYTDFDKNNNIEKSAVNLVEYVKTPTIPAHEKVSVNVEFDLTDMKSYDSAVHKTYLLEKGDYYITAAHNAHDAVNNILLSKDSSVSSKLLAAGDATRNDQEGFTYKHVQANDVEVKEGANKEISNLFEGDQLDQSYYLSRKNWSKMDGLSSVASNVIASGSLTTATGEMAGKSNVMGTAGYVGTFEATAKMKELLAATGYEGSGNPNAKSSFDDSKARVYKEDNGLELVDLVGKKFDDPLWDKLLNQMKFSEIYELFGHAGYGTIAIESINKPKTLEYDGPTGINSFVNGTKGYGFPHEIVVAQTWNKDLSREVGRLIGNDAIKMSSGSDKVPGWYAPACNIHRTPFSGRNYEYYSEDAVLSGKQVAEVIKGVQSKGVYVYLKHYALNDQETNRSVYGNVATFATEQTMRECYLKAFEIGVREGKAKGIMTSMNRVGYKIAAGNYALNTSLLRDEWGFDGIIITDYSGGLSASASDMILASGGDLIMTSGWNANVGALSNHNDAWVRCRLRESAHRVLYVQANSLAMNGMVKGVAYDAGLPIYKVILWSLYAVVGGVVVGLSHFVYSKLFWSQDRWENRKRITKKGWITIASITAGVILVSVVCFCIFLLPVLQKAFVM